MWGRSPGKHSGGGKERLTRKFRRVQDAAITQPWGMSGWEGAAVAEVWRVEDGRGSGRAAGGGALRKPHPEGRQSGPARSLQAPRTSSCANCRLRQQETSGGGEAERGRGREGPSRAAAGSDLEAGVAKGGRTRVGGPLGRAGRVPAVRRGPGGAPFLAAPRVGGFPHRRRRRLCSPRSHRWIPSPLLPGTAPSPDPPFPRGRPADSSEPPKEPSTAARSRSPAPSPSWSRPRPAPASPLAPQSCGLPGLVRLR